MVCQRCRGLLVRETLGGLREETGDMDPTTRCINSSIVDISRTLWFVRIASALLRQNGRYITEGSVREAPCS